MPHETNFILFVDDETQEIVFSILQSYARTLRSSIMFNMINGRNAFVFCVGAFEDDIEKMFDEMKAATSESCLNILFENEHDMIYQSCKLENFDYHMMVR